MKTPIPGTVLNPNGTFPPSNIDDFKDDPEKSQAVIDIELEQIAGELQRIRTIAIYLDAQDHFQTRLHDILEHYHEWYDNIEKSDPLMRELAQGSRKKGTGWRCSDERDFWESTGDRYETVDDLFDSPEGVEVLRLWSGKLRQKYPTFKAFIASPEAAQIRERYGLVLDGSS